MVKKEILSALYKFLRTPRLRYSFFFEWARRAFFTYETREEAMRKIMEFAAFRNLGGDYMEFGTYAGDSFIRAFYFAKYAGLPSMKFYAFDSFSGYPPLEGIDKECGYFREGSYMCDLDTLKKRLRHAGVDMRKVVIIPGLFENLNENTREKIESKIVSAVWIDCDLYKPTRLALEFVTPYLTDGTIVVLADWLTCNGAPDICQPRAFQEWRDNHREIGLADFPVVAGLRAFVVSQPHKQKINKILPQAPKEYRESL